MVLLLDWHLQMTALKATQVSWVKRLPFGSKQSCVLCTQALALCVCALQLFGKGLHENLSELFLCGICGAFLFPCDECGVAIDLHLR